MRLLTVLVLFLLALFVFGCTGVVNKSQNQNVANNVATGSAADDLNINSIDSVSSDDGDIASANTQIDETSSLISNW